MPAKKETVKKETVKTEAEKKTVKKAAATGQESRSREESRQDP